MPEKKEKGTREVEEDAVELTLCSAYVEKGRQMEVDARAKLQVAKNGGRPWGADFNQGTTQTSSWMGGG